MATDAQAFLRAYAKCVCRVCNLQKELPVVQQPIITEPEPITQEYEPKEPIVPEFVIEEPKEKSPFYMGLKTNLLYNILAIPNLGAEFYLGSNFSVATNWHYAWWKNDKSMIIGAHMVAIWLFAIGWGKGSRKIPDRSSYRTVRPNDNL